MLDFGSGAISDGFLQGSYGERTTQWNVTFNGFLNGAVTEFDMVDLALMRFGEPVVLDGNPGATMAGMLTGPEGQRHVGGCNLVAPLGSGDSENVHGLWVIDGLAQ